jgi:hypothetical protein
MREPLDLDVFGCRNVRGDGGQRRHCYGRLRIGWRIGVAGTTGQDEQRQYSREGDAAFEGRQRFFDVVAMLARERRLSRLAYTAEKQN